MMTAANPVVPTSTKTVQAQAMQVHDDTLEEYSYLDLSSDEDDPKKVERPASVAVWRKVKKVLGLKQKIKERKGSDWEAGIRPARRGEMVL